MLGGYSSPISVANAFLFKSDLVKFMESMIEDVSLLALNNEAEDFIPPIVYNEMGKCFNVDYNFLVHSLSYLHGEEGIKNDFMMVDGMDINVLKNAKFLIAGILEGYYGLVMINKGKVDMNRFKYKQIIDTSLKFYNVVCIKNGKNVRRFSAVPFSESVLKNLVSEDAFYSLMKVAKSDSFEQVVFGQGAYEKYLSEALVPLRVWS